MKRMRVTAGLVAVAVGAAVLIAAIAGNGSSTHGRASGSFTWLHPAAAPDGWTSLAPLADRRSHTRPDGGRSRPTPARRRWGFCAAAGSRPISTPRRGRAVRRSLTGAAFG